MTESLAQQISDMASMVKDRTAYRPKIAIILGSGLGEFAELLQDSDAIPGGDLPGYPVSTVPGHKGRLVFGKLDGSIRTFFKPFRIRSAGIN